MDIFVVTMDIFRWTLQITGAAFFLCSLVGVIYWAGRRIASKIPDGQTRTPSMPDWVTMQETPMAKLKSVTEKREAELAELYRRCADSMEGIVAAQAHQTKLLTEIADGTIESVRQQKKLSRVFRGDSYDEVDDSRARKIEEITELMERHGINREEATARVDSQRTYSRDGLGLKGR